MVPRAGFEPAQLSPLPPQDSVSTNSTTWAFFMLQLFSTNRDAPKPLTTRFAWPLVDSCLSRHSHSCASSTNSTTWAFFLLSQPKRPIENSIPFKIQIPLLISATLAVTLAQLLIDHHSREAQPPMFASLKRRQEFAANRSPYLQSFQHY